MYKVIHGFIDSVEDRNYKAGDTFVVGKKTDEKRIAVLSGSDNNLNRPLIEKVDEDKPLDKLTIDELKTIAANKGLEFDAKIKKADLIALITAEPVADKEPDQTADTDASNGE